MCRFGRRTGPSISTQFPKGHASHDAKTTVTTISTATVTTISTISSCGTSHSYPRLEWHNDYQALLQKVQENDDHEAETKSAGQTTQHQHQQQQQLLQEYEMCRLYAGEYCLKQLARTHAQLHDQLLQHYEHAVQATTTANDGLAVLGQLTPILSQVQLEQDAVRLYLQFLRHLLQQSLRQAQKQQQSQQQGNTATTSPPPALF